MTVGGVEGVVVLARPADGREVRLTDFVDITEVPVVETGWEGTFLRVVFAGPLTAGQVAAVRRRVVSSTPAEEALRAALEERLAAAPVEGEDLRGWLVDVTRLALCIGTGQAPSSEES